MLSNSALPRLSASLVQQKAQTCQPMSCQHISLAALILRILICMDVPCISDSPPNNSSVSTSLMSPFARFNKSSIPLRLPSKRFTCPGVIRLFNPLFTPATTVLRLVEEELVPAESDASNDKTAPATCTDCRRI